MENTNQSNGPDSKRKKFLKYANWWPTIIGSIFVLIAISIEYMHKLSTANAGIETDYTLSSIFSFEIVVKLVSEIGYAFIIAGAVSTFIEMNAKREQNNIFQSNLNEISKSVVQSIFAIEHSDSYVKSVVGTCFESALVREDYVINYDINKISDYSSKLPGVDATRFVIVEANVRYKARNRGADHNKFPTGYGIPLRAGPLGALAGMTSLRVGDKEYNDIEIAQLIVDCEQGDTHERTYEFEVPLDAGESKDVSIGLRLVKEMSDNDAFGFRRPTMGASITVNDRTGELFMGITPRTSASLRTERKPEVGKSGEWSIDGPILPFDSVVVWWRTKEDNGGQA